MAGSGCSSAKRQGRRENGEGRTEKGERTEQGESRSAGTFSISPSLSLLLSPFSLLLSQMDLFSPTTLASWQQRLNASTRFAEAAGTWAGRLLLVESGGEVNRLA